MAGAFPLYACLRAASHESLAGTMTFGYDDAFEVLNGTLSWLSPSAAAVSSNGLSVELPAAGSYYRPPEPHIPLLDFPYYKKEKYDGVIAASSPDLSLDFDAEFTWSRENVVRSVSPSSHLAFNLNLGTGLFSGHAIDPITRRLYSFRGVITPDFNEGYGMLIRNGAVIGTAEVSPNPF